MSSAEEFGRALDELRDQIEELAAVANARAQAINEVLNTFADFAMGDRRVNAGALVEDCGVLFNKLTSMSSMRKLGMDVSPKVVRLSDGSYMTPEGLESDDINDAYVFFGPRRVDPGQEVVSLHEEISEKSKVRERME